MRPARCSWSDRRERIVITDSALSGLDTFPRVPLGHSPTPLDQAPALGRELGVDLYIKRDDCTGLAFGGNKVRQLEFYIGAAVAERADTVLITGAVQSNFVRLAAAAARTVGMEIHIQLEERVPDVDESYRSSGNVLLDKLLGAHLSSFPVGEDESAADASLEALAVELAGKGRRPYVIHLGVDHPPLGALGYVVAARELAIQMAERELDFDHVGVASGSALTHSGLLVGLRALGNNVPVTGICVRRGADEQRPRVFKRCREVAALIGREDCVTESDVAVSDALLAPGYGQMNTATMSAMAMAARLEALMLDPVYTGKTMAGLVALARGGTFQPGARVLFMHTGGLPALFGYERTLSSHLEKLDAPHAA
jgi:D-cysteine desulfhydrase family pyridoxal phosphate-dependent enzyme